jgi:hypothetical protein
MIAAYVKAAGRDAWLAPPDDPARRSGPWPSGRTWYLASRLLAAIEAVSPGNRLLQGRARRPRRRSGAAVPRVPRDAEPARSRRTSSKDPRSFVLPDRVDRAYAVCYALRRRRHQQQDAAALGGGDDRARRARARRTRHSPTAARARSATRQRPEGLTKLPDECRPFYELMQLAKLVPRE